MGLTWTTGKPVKNGETMLFSARFPEDKVESRAIWAFRRKHRAELSADNFSVSKYPNTPNGKWSINYWHDMSNPEYKAEFKARLVKWRNLFVKHQKAAGKPIKPRFKFMEPEPVEEESSSDNLEALFI